MREAEQPVLTPNKANKAGCAQTLVKGPVMQTGKVADTATEFVMACAAFRREQLAVAQPWELGPRTCTHLLSGCSLLVRCKHRAQ